MRRVVFFGYVLPLLLVVVLFCLCLAVGSVRIPVRQVCGLLVHGASQSGQEVWSHIVRNLRVPQALTALLSGAALATGGLLLQVYYRNPLADPSLLGVNAGAGLGVAVAMLVLGGGFYLESFTLSGFALVVTAALVGAGLVLWLLLVCSAIVRDGVTLLLVGVMLSFLASSVVSLLSFFATAEGVHSFVVWGMGDFSGVSWERMPAFAAVIVSLLTVCLLMVKPLQALLLGEDYARSLGISIRPVRTLLLFLTGLLAATVTALCGPISFIGLAMPHAARLTIGTASMRHLMPATMGWGAVTALLALLLSHLPGEGGSLPLGALIPLLSLPIVILVLLRR